MREADLPRYRHPSGAKVTLITVLSTQDGSGAHSALIVNGAQRVIFDPAGSLSHASLAERGDVIYGANPAVPATPMTQWRKPEMSPMRWPAIFLLA